MSNGRSFVDLKIKIFIKFYWKYLGSLTDKPQKMTRRQRRELRMSQKKAEMEYRKKLDGVCRLSLLFEIF